MPRIWTCFFFMNKQMHSQIHVYLHLETSCKDQLPACTLQYDENDPQRELFPLMIMPSQIKSHLIESATLPPTLSHFTLSSIPRVATETGYYDTYLIHFVSSQGIDVSRARRADNCLLWRMRSQTGPGRKHAHARLRQW